MADEFEESVDERLLEQLPEMMIGEKYRPN